MRFWEVCPDDQEHHARPVHHRCHRPACPECWPSWAHRQANRAAEALEGYQETNHHHRAPRHIDLTPDPALIPVFDDPAEYLPWLNQEGHRAARILGVVAAVSFSHSYRIKPEKRDQADSMAIAAGEKTYQWVLKQADWRDWVNFYPHLHLIGFGRLLDARQFHDRTGWEYHNHDASGPGRRGAVLRQTIHYLLSHAWVNGNHKVVRYLFGMSTHRLMRVDEGFERVEVRCPKCQALCVALPPDAIQGDGTARPIYQDAHNAPPALRRVALFHYEIRIRKPRLRSLPIDFQTPAGKLPPSVTT